MTLIPRPDPPARPPMEGIDACKDLLQLAMEYSGRSENVPGYIQAAINRFSEETQAEAWRRLNQEAKG